MPYVSLRQYEYLVAVARAGSLTEAARLLNVSQPSLSVAIARTEERLGRRLFVRGRGRPFRPTPEGQAFIVRAEALLAQAALLEDPVGACTAERRRASIGFFDDLAPRWFAPALGALGRTAPEIDIVPSVGGFAELARGLGDGTLSFALTWDLGLDGSFQRAVVARVSPYAFVAADHALAKRRRVTLERLAAEPLVLCDDGLSIQHVLRLFGGRRPRPRVVHRAASLEIMRSLAAHGEGVGISYTNPPYATSHDGTPIASVRIADRTAVESVVLASRADADPSLPSARMAATIRALA